jgi:adenylyltransferase/sulfurtransferase
MPLTSSELLSRVKEEVRQVQPDQARAMMAADPAVRLVDVREREETLDGYIRGACLIPRGSLELRIEAEVTSDRDLPLILYCAGGNRSALAARDLTAMGYTRVCSLAGGIQAWKAAGYEVVRKEVLPDRDLQRYARHLLLPEVGESGQLRLLKAKVLVVGIGGLGCPASLYLAAAGVGNLGLVDADVVDRSNLQRQVLYGEGDVGRPKVEVARRRLLDLNPEIAVQIHPMRLIAANALELLAGYDLVINGCDNFPTRYLISDASVLNGKPVVDGSIYRFEGQVTVYRPGKGPCYRCLYPEPPPPGEVPTCAEAGVLGVLPGVVGLMQATEAIKLILDLPGLLVGRLLLYEALTMGFREVRTRRNPACPVCGDQPSITRLIDYEEFCGAPGQPAAQR